MKNISKIIRTFSIAAAAALFVLAGGSLTATMAQSRDPFRQAPYAKPRVVRPSTGTGSTNTGSTGKVPVVKEGPHVVAAPEIDARIEYYKRVREQAALSGQPIPKVTSVLLLSEMSVTGIFRTPRGFAAMVEATPIKLSYTIYPGEKFFDGQLVAVEENRLVFRKVTKWSTGKFVASVENMPLREYSLQQDIQGTSPAGENYSRKPSSAKSNDGSKVAPIVSPLEEMNKSVEDESKEAESAKKKPKKKKKAVSKKRRKS